MILYKSLAEDGACQMMQPSKIAVAPVPTPTPSVSPTGLTGESSSTLAPRNGEPGGLRLLRWGSLASSIFGALLAGLWTFQDEQKAAIAQAYQNVALVRQYTERLTQTILQEAAEAHASSEDADGYLRSRGFHEFLATVEASQSFTYGLAVIDLDGTLMSSSRSFPVQASFAGRDYLAAIESGMELFLDRIKLEPGGQDALIVAQPFRHNSFSGVIVSAVAVTEIRDFLSSVAREEGEAASLLREDGKLLVRQSPSNPTFLDPSSPAARAIKNAPEGDYEATATTDGTRRIYAYSKVAGLPVYANFGVPVASVWSLWFWRTLPIWLLLSAGVTFSWIVSLLISRNIQERYSQEEQVSLRREAEQKAQQQTHFMMELNHRIKNNLSMVNSMIAMQTRRGSMKGDALRARIQAVADVHDLLYRAANAFHVDLGELIQQVCASPALLPSERNILTICEVENGIIVDANQATPLALVVVELLTNSVKHAFPKDRPGRIDVKLARNADGNITLLIADDGVGLPAKSSRNSGINIVASFVAQIGGTIKQLTGLGTSHEITFSPHSATEEDRRTL